MIFIEYRSGMFNFSLISITSTPEMSMGFKKTSRSMDFADLAMANCIEQNLSIKLTLINVSLTLQSAS
jgi:hypothetical protein